MKEWILQNKELIICLGSIFLTLIGGSIGLLGRSNAKLRNRLKAAKRQSYSIRCPHCKKEAPLSEVSFVMPDGRPDNNLNGVADDDE